MTGFRAGVGERRKQDAAIPIGVMIEMQNLLEEEWAAAIEADDKDEQRRVAENAAFFLLCFCGSLRGFEGPKIVLDELRDQVVLPGDRQPRVQEPHIGIPLAGRFKARSQQVQKIFVLWQLKLTPD